MNTNTLAHAPATDPGAQERFARDRRYFERVVLARLGTTLSREDAEDIVSDALIDSADRCPSDAINGGRAWFARVVLNKAEDFRRARDGRPRASRGPSVDPKRQVVSRRFISIHALEAAPRAASALAIDESCAFAEVEEAAEREAAVHVVEGALASLPPAQAELLRLRHLQEEPLPRSEVAARLGLSISQFETRHSAAWRALVAAVRALDSTAAPEAEVAAISTLRPVVQLADRESARHGTVERIAA
jgi:RNA polymerase sigma factor (sigma-70 family)